MASFIVERSYIIYIYIYIYSKRISQVIIRIHVITYIVQIDLHMLYVGFNTRLHNTHSSNSIHTIHGFTGPLCKDYRMQEMRSG